jgi:hypothetical protein
MPWSDAPSIIVRLAASRSAVRASSSRELCSSATW